MRPWYTRNSVIALVHVVFLVTYMAGVLLAVAGGRYVPGIALVFVGGLAYIAVVLTATHLLRRDMLRGSAKIEEEFNASHP